MKKLSALSIPVAIALALVSVAGSAQDRPNTLQKSKANALSSSKAGKNTSQSSVQPSGTGGRVDGKRIAPTATQTAPATEAVDHDCHGQASDA